MRRLQSVAAACVRHRALAAFLVLLAVTVRQAEASLSDTGFDPGGLLAPNFVPDANYTLASSPYGTTGPTAVAYVPAYPGWLPDTSVSQWIGPNVLPEKSALPGHYDYQVTFTLPSGVTDVTGRWASDNEGLDILVNGHSSGNSIAGGPTDPSSFDQWHAFDLNKSGNFLTGGLNTLDFIVNNEDGIGPTGLRVEFTTPEPSSVIVVGITALLGLFLLMFPSFRRLSGRIA